MTDAEPTPMPRRVAVGALALTSACLPLYVVRWHLGPLPTTLLENLILLTIAAYVWVLWAGRAPDRALAAACLGLTLIGTLLTLSRGAYGAMAALVVMVVASLPGWRLRIASTVTLLAAFVAFLKIPIIAARLSDVQYS